MKSQANAPCFVSAHIPIEMADLLLLLETVGDGYRLTKDRQRRAKELRESIIAGTPLGQRVSA